ncbi:SH3 domain-containing protein [Chlorobium phaeobacteroides]|jgi:uncharacterized protein YgiM (DUF1202 family)|uniref:SH3, type 3 domain protein n=1 Tax=Chlorobium phaeobacteroides (strain DSM 266 / SMG 266 / 2430) TaxID=290317 RepID=A1BCK2_CHLPD|nr:SH3 domain-containing protein [Chlorobium phaeobacteroides]ABL64129.1 SH3, type 3 domain protein [Chlorobium phaeobacteroides DSM 266]MBV5330425.1 SH3 domain-containing protein [Chlorobium sp.]
MAEENKNFWGTIPGILTGIGTVLTAATGFYMAISGGSPTAKHKPEASAPPATAVMQATVQTTPAKEEVTPHLQDIFILKAVIDDPDGFTNVRSMKSSSSSIVAKVTRNEQFHTYLQDGSWWQVKTADGKIGYMHTGHIRILQDPR